MTSVAVPLAEGGAVPTFASVRLPKAVAVDSGRLSRIKKGHRAMDMEDKWNVVTSKQPDGWHVSFNRSWTGHPIFKTVIAKKGRDYPYQIRRFEWNTNPNQYRPAIVDDRAIAAAFMQTLKAIFPSSAARAARSRRSKSASRRTATTTRRRRASTKNPTTKKRRTAK